MTQQPGGWSGSDPMPSLQEYMQQQRQQKFWDMLSQMGQGLMAANRQGQSPLRAVSAGLARGRPASGHGTGGLLDWMKMRGYEQKQKAEKQYQNLVTGGSGYDPSTGIDWNQARPGNPDVTKGMTPVQRGLLSSLPREQGLGLLADRAFDVPSAPTVREFKEGNRVVTKRWEPSTRSWVQMGDAPRFKPGERGDLTLAQQSSNAEIDQARASLDRRGLDKAEIQRRTQKALNTGRSNPEYDDDLGRVVRMATQRKTGNDPDYQRYFRTYLGGLEFSEPAGMRPLPPGVSAEEPGLFQRGYGYLFGDGGATSQPNPPGAAGNPLIPQPGDGRGTRPTPSAYSPMSTRGPRGHRGPPPARRTGSVASIPRMTVQDIDDLINQRGDTLSPAELKAVQARLAALGIR